MNKKIFIYGGLYKTASEFLAEKYFEKLDKNFFDVFSTFDKRNKKFYHIFLQIIYGDLNIEEGRKQIHEIIKRFEVDIIQVLINILDRRLIDNGTFEILNIKGIEVHARSIFLQGLLLMDKESLPKKFNKWNSLWDVWHQWLNDNKISALEASIGFAMSLPEISKILVGVNSMSQLKSILNCANFQLPELPESFYSDDLELLNPVNWKNL